ncbi:MAG: efflux RND transporter permease subunit [Pseudomonadota bacterium]|nr:efflux RND transporter permease subunit [Pseudomonadota bacterium]
MNLTAFALNRPVLAAVVIVAIVVFGLYTLRGYPSQENPEYTIREAVVTAGYPGMSPQRVEDLISRPIEEKIREIPEVKIIESSSKTGVSVTHVTVYDRHFDLDPIWQDLRNKMADVGRELPEGTLGPAVNDDFGSVTIASIALTADGFSLEEMRETAKSLRNRIYPLAGVRRIDLYGVQEERVFLEVNGPRLARYGLTPRQIIQTLQNQNVILPGGTAEIQGENIIIEPTGNFEDTDDIRKVVIEVPASGRVAYLRDIVDIRRAYVDPPARPVYFNGQPAVVLAVSMVAGTDIVDLGRRLAARVRALESALPIGYTLDFATFQPALVQTSIADFTNNLYQTLGIVLLVVLLFLGVRTGLVVGTIIPATMLMALIFMRQWDILLQTVSIASLIIALGLLVDNGIVMAEDIRTRISQGVSRRQAAIAAGQELALPLLTSSLTTILAFLPLMLAQNKAGEFTRSLSQVILIVLLCSWFLAVYITPLLCYWFVRPAKKAETYAGRFYDVYRRLLGAIIRFRLLFLALCLGLLVAAGAAFKMVPQQFFPPSERDQFTVYLYLVNGASSRQTDAVVRRFAAWLNDEQINPEVAGHIAYVGQGGPRFYLSLAPIDPDTHAAFVLVDLKPGSDREALMRRTREALLAHFPEVRGEVKQLSIGPTEEGLVEIRIAGADAAVLEAASENLKAALRAVPGTLAIKDDWGNKVRKAVVNVDQARARRAGVTSEEIAQSLNSLLSGTEVTDLRQGDQSIPVLIRAGESDRDNLDRLRTATVYSSASGHNVPLLQVADFELIWQDGEIVRRNLERTRTVAARNEVLFARDLLAAVQPAVDALALPPGYRIEIGGELESSREARGALFQFLPACGFAIFVLMVWQFNSIRKPLIIFLTIPLAMIGAIVGLLATGAVFGFMAMLGFLSLAGIVINNAIVLIDRIDLELAEGATPYDAVLNASVKRLRPILMTTLTTVLGLLPLIFFGGEMWFGMANAIAFGLGIGTFMTLGAVPALYALLYRVQRPRPREAPTRTLPAVPAPQA